MMSSTNQMMEPELSPDEPLDDCSCISASPSDEIPKELLSAVHSVAKKAEIVTVASSVKCDTGGASVTNEKEDPIVIIAAGLPRSGKSRALSNIFDIPFEYACSASSVTSKVESVMTMIYENTLKVIDIPGLGDQEIPTVTVAKQLKKAVGKSEYVLLYCISVAPDHSLNIADAHVMATLQKTLGREVWKKCVILLTFSDLLRNEAKENYGNILRNHVTKINTLLQKIQQSSWSLFKKPPIVEVKIDDDVDINQEEIYDIVSIPVYYDIKEDDKKIKIEEKWRLRAIIEVLRKKGPLQRKRLLDFVFRRKMESIMTYTATGAVNSAAGASLGGVIGGVAGLAAGGVGCIPGAIIGAAVGGTISLTISEILVWVYKDRATRSRSESNHSDETLQPLLAKP